jgi:hypothetical protein
MKPNPKTVKKGLILAAALLTGFSSLATSYLSQAAYAAPKRSLVYYRVAPWRNHVPHEAGYSDYGIRQFVLPDGTVTGPIAPDANGG